ncbi:MAG: Veg family protein [Clostridia bacterium]
MRTISQDITGTINRLKQMKGINYIIKVNRGRNRIETIEGVIESVYPAIFTVRTDAGELNSFSYADLFSRNISFKAKQE